MENGRTCRKRTPSLGSGAAVRVKQDHRGCATVVSSLYIPTTPGELKTQERDLLVSPECVVLEAGSQPLWPLRWVGVYSQSAELHNTREMGSF